MAIEELAISRIYLLSLFLIWIDKLLPGKIKQEVFHVILLFVQKYTPNNFLKLSKQYPSDEK